VHRLSRQLADDCEAFNGGHIVEQLESHRLPPESWMWMNLLAHGSPLDLRNECLAAHGRRAAGNPWREARSYLSARVLDSAGDAASLAELQEEVLLPIELALVTDRRAVRRPSDWVIWVEAAVAAHCRAHQRGRAAPSEPRNTVSGRAPAPAGPPNSTRSDSERGPVWSPDPHDPDCDDVP
jgi:hypothetical protein